MPHCTALHYTNYDYSYNYNYATLHYTTLDYTTLHYTTLHSLNHHTCNCNYTALSTLQLHYTTLHPAIVGEVTDQVTTATIVAIPKDTTPTTFQSISGFALPPVRDSQQSTSPLGFLFRHCLVRHYWYRTYFALIPVTKPHHARKKVRLRKDWGFWPRAPQQCPRKLHWRAWHLQHYWKSRTRNLIIGVRWLNSSNLDELGMVSRARIFVGRGLISPLFLGNNA